jgi:hypothetical protein
MKETAEQETGTVARCRLNRFHWIDSAQYQYSASCGRRALPRRILSHGVIGMCSCSLDERQMLYKQCDAEQCETDMVTDFRHRAMFE